MKTVIVTGATRGIGKAIADYYISQDYQVFGTGTASQETLDDLKTKNLTLLHADFGNKDSLNHLCDFIQELPVLDILVNNAGINIVKSYQDIEHADYDAMHDINLRACFHLSRTSAQVMSGRGGHIVNIASIWSVITKRHRAMYSTMKAGIVGMTKSLAVELAEENILVNAISPGFIETDLTRKNMGASGMAEVSAQVPMNRLGKPEEIASIVGMITSENNTYMTGQNIVVDGGFTIV